jgi:hypothetical protein
VKDGFDVLIERAIRMGRYDLIAKVVEARDQAEREYYEAINQRRKRTRKVRW